MKLLAAFDEAGRLQARAEFGHDLYGSLGRLWMQEPDHRHRRTLRARRERPRRRASEPRDELPTIHGWRVGFFIHQVGRKAGA